MGNRTSSRALCATAIFQMVGVGLIVALLPSRVMGLSHSISYVGFLASAFAVPFVLFQLPVGIIGDLYGHKRILAAGYIISCLTGAAVVGFPVNGHYLPGRGPLILFSGRVQQK